MSKYAFLRSSATLLIIGSLLGLISGFKIANLQYRGEQSVAKNREIARAASGMSGSQDDVNAIIEKARENPNDTKAQMDAVSAFIQINRPQEAMPFLEQARKTDPNNPRIIAGFGIVYLMMRQYDQAIEWLKRSREQGADIPAVTIALIDSYLQTGKNLDEAGRLLKELEAQKIDPATLAQIRADLDAARKGGTGNQGAAPNEKNSQAQKPKTTLSHGPEEPKISR